jgi:hypothetical protein
MGKVEKSLEWKSGRSLGETGQVWIYVPEIRDVMYPSQRAASPYRHALLSSLGCRVSYRSLEVPRSFLQQHLIFKIQFAMGFLQQLPTELLFRIVSLVPQAT